MSDPISFYNSQASLARILELHDVEGSYSYISEPLLDLSIQDIENRLKNIDWSFTNDDTSFGGHDLHPYPAKFIPQIPGQFIEYLSRPGETVLDPFGGSGTTALEAIRHNRQAISIDINPISQIIGRVKTANLSELDTQELLMFHSKIRSQLESMPSNPTTMIEKYKDFSPNIPNRQKWFSEEAFGELCYIKYCISKLTASRAVDIAKLALSRSAINVSFQDSETRYKSVPRKVLVGETLKRYVKDFEFIIKIVSKNEVPNKYGNANFICSDIREFENLGLLESSVDLVVTSPPYGNATDYHLYHRFRLLWLDFDPNVMGKKEIGSHLKHQRENSGFTSYFDDLKSSLSNIYKLLRPGRYAVLVIGNSIYEGNEFDTAALLDIEAKKMGFTWTMIIERNIHITKRSFTAAGRRATTEKILILQKEDKYISVQLLPPPYQLWKYEEILSKKEISTYSKTASDSKAGDYITIPSSKILQLKNLVFTHNIIINSSESIKTWQCLLENGTAKEPSSRKDPKYVTHGIHDYKGKFYPQLAKALLNLSHITIGANVLDPFCGSGTTLLESYLSGFHPYGCDINPIATMIANSKVNILTQVFSIVTEVYDNIVQQVRRHYRNNSNYLNEFPDDCHEELMRWFEPGILKQISSIIHSIKACSEGIIKEFYLTILSSIIREVSNQDSTDLRIRYKKILDDSVDVISLYKSRADIQLSRIEKFFKIRNSSPHLFCNNAIIYHGDNRLIETYNNMGLFENSIDAIVTSPPYAMALPYIDTDRLSMLSVLGIANKKRSALERNLIGSREINKKEKCELEVNIKEDNILPVSQKRFLLTLITKIEYSTDAGFRKQNMPSLLYRFLLDMHSVLVQARYLCKPNSYIYMVIGDSKMTVDNNVIPIETTKYIEEIANKLGFLTVDKIDISVTTENYKHIKNSIKENIVLVLRNNKN